MSSVTSVTDSSYSEERGLNDLAAELTLEICSYLEARDQLAARSVCQRWRSDLSEVFLSRYVDMDASKMPDQAKYHDQRPSQKYYQYVAVSEKRLEHALNRHIQKNTKVLILRHVVSDGIKFGIVARIIKEKQAALFQLILQDCEVEVEYAGAVHCWLNPQTIQNHMMPGLIFVTRKLTLNNYTIRDAVAGISSSCHCVMPGGARLSLLQMLLRNPDPPMKVPVVLPRHEFDCSKPFVEHYHPFIMALESHCPQVSAEVRKDVVRLYSSWIHDDTIEEYQWRALGVVIKCVNEGVPATEKDAEVNVAALRQLDPLTLSKLTMGTLHRMYCST